MRQTRFRADLVAGEGLRISGMLAPYNQRGSGGDLFRPGLFDLAGADLLLYLQHDRGAALARTNAGLVVSDADQGILLAADLVDTDLGRRTHTLIGCRCPARPIGGVPGARRIGAGNRRAADPRRDPWRADGRRGGRPRRVSRCRCADARRHA